MTLTLHTSQVRCFGVMHYAVMSLSAPCLQVQVAKLASGCFYCWSLCVTITWSQIFKGALQVTIASVLPHVTVERLSADLGR